MTNHLLTDDEQYLLSIWRAMPDARQEMILKGAENIKLSHEMEERLNRFYGRTSLMYRVRSA